MAISSINFAKSSGGSFAHNDRTEKEPVYLLPVEHRLENECDRSALEAQKMLEDLFENAKENYQKTYGQKFQTKFENVHWEAVINLNKEHTIKDVERLVREIEKETGFTAVQISIHRDEGRINEKTDHPIYNLHAHVNFFTLDPETGQQLYRRSISNSEREKIRKEHNIPDGEKIPRHLTGVMDKTKLSKLQDITAEALGMERGERGSTKVRLGHKQHRAVEKEKEKLLEKIDELQKENTELKKYNFRDIQKQITALEGINSEQKKELHRLNTEINKTQDQGEKDEKIKELIEQIKAKDLTIDQLKERTDQGQSIPANLEEIYSGLKGMERYEAHKQMRAIVGDGDGVELGSVKKHLELSQGEIKSLKVQLQEAMKVPHEPINARMINNLKSEVEMLQITNRVLEREVTELKENRTAVDVSKEIEKQIEEIRIPTVSVEGGVDHDESALMKYRSAIENQGKKATPQYFENMIDQYSTTVMGVGKIDKKALATQLATEKKEDYLAAASVYNIANELIKYKDKAKEVLKSIVESSKNGLESIFSKITGKSISEVQKERTEFLNAQKERERSDRQKEDRSKGIER